MKISSLTAKSLCVAGVLASVSSMVAAPVQAEPAAPAIDPQAIMAIAAGDITGDGRADAAILVAPPEDEPVGDVGLYLFVRHEWKETLVPALHVPNLVWGAREMAGQEPSVAINASGSLLVTSQNSAIGRDRWEETLTIAWRDGAFVVAGYTYSYYDTLDPENNGGCDVNLRTGKGTKRIGETSTALALKPQRIPVAEWRTGDAEEDRDVCAFRN